MSSLNPWRIGAGSFALGFAVALAATAARAADGVPITIINDGTTDVIVVVYDTNAASHGVVVPGERINGFSSVPITVTPDRDGRANVSWIATTVDTHSPRCGRANEAGLLQDAVVHVYANASCSAFPAIAG